MVRKRHLLTPSCLGCVVVDFMELQGEAAAAAAEGCVAGRAELSVPKRVKELTFIFILFESHLPLLTF